ncbi:MAG: HNH endonuclease [Planctomycetes bacterium]|nr:HNH endonuclease [Planctomycetota bacterium]
MNATLARLVRERAQERCEYCKMHQDIQGANFHVEHVVPRSRGGETAESNLALACPTCNFHKSDKAVALDPESGETTELFHPRRQRWEDHFVFRGLEVLGRTPCGRATVGLLEMNGDRRLRIRELERALGLLAGSP